MVSELFHGEFKNGRAEFGWWPVLVRNIYLTSSHESCLSCKLAMYMYGDGAGSRKEEGKRMMILLPTGKLSDSYRALSCIQFNS